MVILKEGNPPQPRYPRYDTLVPWAALNGHHTKNAQCDKGAEQKRHRLESDDMREITTRALQDYTIMLKFVTSFKLLVQIMTPSDEDWPTVEGNLQKARKR